MKQGTGAALFLLLLCGQGIAAPPARAIAQVRAQRIMSLKICTDELLMDLVSVRRIASVSALSREPAALQLWPIAASIPVNHNTAEEVLAAKPDLILTDPYVPPAMRALLAKSGARIVEVPDAENFDDIRRVTRLVGAAVGEPARAEELIAGMDATLKDLAADRPAHPPRVAGWGGGGFVPGRATLFNAVLEAAGGVNIAGADTGYYDVESLLAARPDVLAFADDYLDSPSLRGDQNDHPVLVKFFAARRVAYPAALLTCGVPESADAARQLHDALGGAMAAQGGIP